MTNDDHSASDLPARAVLASVAVFWLGWIVLMSVRAFLLGFNEPGDLAPRRVAAAIGGASITIAFWRGLRHVRSDRPALLAMAALVGAVPATVAFACLNWFLFYGWSPPPSIAARSPTPPTPRPSSPRPTPSISWTGWTARHAG